jgi:hypothetical protein
MNQDQSVKEMRVINIKLYTGFSTLDAKSNKDSEGCLLNAMPILLLEKMVTHIQGIIEFKKSKVKK